MSESRSLFGLDGKTALVTGAAKGLGMEIALAFARHGASLILADLEYPERTETLIREMKRSCLAVQTDVADESRVEQLVGRAVSEFGDISILVNNAGISQLSYTPTQDLPVEEWDRVLGINLRGAFLCCKHVGRSMIEKGGGSIVNIASTAGITGVPRAPAYSASKAGLILLTKSLALEWANYGIRVNAVAPHYLETDLTEGLRTDEKVYRALTRQIPLRRFGKTSEIADAVLFVASGMSSFMTGAVIPVDGGYLAQ
jgi:NAD(P)-dependent dehydrogenase (short-subunit alcohol dehydrogenase family)